MTSRRRAEPVPGLDAICADWLLDRGSLTRRLVEIAGPSFAVVALREEPGTLSADECQRLGQPPGAAGWIREVHLTGLGQPLIFARSVMVAANGSEDAAAPLQRGSVPLGQLLFGDTPWSRSEIQLCRAPENHWQRHSIFSRKHQHILVQEVFLPALWEVLNR
jgi:chorismate--pyruvate lyase